MTYKIGNIKIKTGNSYNYLVYICKSVKNLNFLP